MASFGASQGLLEPPKNSIFTRFLKVFAIGQFSFQLRRSYPALRYLVFLLGPLGVISGPSWIPLGPSSGPFGPSWGHSGLSWGLFGAILGLSWSILGPLWAILPCIAPAWVHLWAILAHYGPSWGHVGAILGPFLAFRKRRTSKNFDFPGLFKGFCNWAIFLSTSTILPCLALSCPPLGPS